MWKLIVLPFLYCVLALPAFAQPVVTNILGDGIKVQGDTHTFMVRGTGFGGASFQWYFNDTLVPGGPMTNTLNLTDVDPSDSGNYYAIVSTASGSSTSAVAILTVTPRTGFSLDFDAPGQYTNNFNARDITGVFNGAVWGEAGNVGVGGSRGIDAFRSSSDEIGNVYWQQPLSFGEVGTVLNASIMFKYKVPSANNKVVQLGVIAANNVVNNDALVSTVSSTNNNFYNTLSLAYLSVRLNTTNQPGNDTQLQFEWRRLGFLDGNLQRRTNSGATLEPGQWYKLSLSMTNNKNGVGATLTNTILTGTTLQHMGEDGLTPGAILAGWATNISHVSFLTNSPVYLAFTPVDMAGADVIDNIYAWSVDGAPTITFPPLNQTVLQNRSVTFAAGYDGTPPFSYQWMKSGTDIPGATQAQYTIPAATSGNAGDYSVRVANAISTATSAAATLTVTPDTVPPTLLSVGSVTGSKIGVAFNEPVSAATATAIGNYTVTGGGGVTGVSLRPDGQSVELTLASPASGAFTVAVTGVQDLAGNSIVPSEQSGTALNLTPHDVAGVDTIPPLAPGSSFSSKDGEITVTAGGTDFANGADDGHLLLGPARLGDFDVKVRVSNFTRGTLWNVEPGNDESAKAALIARVSPDADSQSVQMAVLPCDLGNPAGLNSYQLSYRRASGAAMTNVAPTIAGLTNIVPYPQGWMRLRRVNNTVTMLRSWNGINWTNMGILNDENLPASMLVGLGASAALRTDANLPISVDFRDYGNTEFPNAILTNNVVLRPATTNLLVPGGFTITALASVAGVHSNELQYVWQRTNSAAGGWTNIPFASSLSYTQATPTFTSADEVDFSSWSWRCIVKVGSSLSVTSSTSTLVGYIDTNPPSIYAVSFPSANLRHIIVSLSKPVTAGTLINLSNYRLITTNLVTGATSDVALQGITVVNNGPTNAVIVLAASADLAPGAYGVSASGLVDLATPPNTTLNTYRRFDVSATALNPGLALIENYYTMNSSASGFDQNQIIALTNSSKFLTNGYDALSYATILGYNTGLGDVGHPDDGARVSSYFVPTTTGNYKFWLRGDDDVMLRMNTNAVDSTGPRRRSPACTSYSLERSLHCRVRFNPPRSRQTLLHRTPQ